VTPSKPRQRLPTLHLKKPLTVIPPYVRQEAHGSAPETAALPALEPKATPPSPRQPETRKNAMLTGRALKVTILLDPVEVVAMRPGGAPRVTLAINVAGRKVSADIAAKSLRKAQTTIGEAGVDGVAVIVQGKLGPGDVVLEAGLVAQVTAVKGGGVSGGQ
jgi:hypothetical protein